MTPEAPPRFPKGPGTVRFLRTGRRTGMCFHVRMTRPTTRVRYLLAVLVSAVVLGACGGSSEADPQAKVTRIAQGRATTSLNVTVSADPACGFITPPCG